MNEFKNLDKFPTKIRTNLKNYLDESLNLHKENIISILNCPRYEQTINLIVIFKILEFKQLKESLKLIKKGLKTKIPAPLFLTLEHIKTSIDSFPLEFLEIKDRSFLIYGDNLLNDIKIEKENLRVELEEQLKGKLIHLREIFLEVGLNPKKVNMLIRDSLNYLIPVFRGILKVKNFDQTPPLDAEKILLQLTSQFNFDNDILIKIYNNYVSKKRLIPKTEIFGIFEAYLKQLEKLSNIVDTI